MLEIIFQIINDYFVGDICYNCVDEISQFFNLIEKKDANLNSSRFNHDTNDKSNYR